MPDIAQLQQQIKAALKRPVVLNLASLRTDNFRLAELATKYATYHDALAIWQDLGVKNPHQVANLSDAQFQQLLAEE